MKKVKIKINFTEIFLDIGAVDKFYFLMYQRTIWVSLSRNIQISTIFFLQAHSKVVSVQLPPLWHGKGILFLLYRRTFKFIMGKTFLHNKAHWSVHRSSYRGRSWRRMCPSKWATWSLVSRNQSPLQQRCIQFYNSSNQNHSERYSGRIVK